MDKRLSNERRRKRYAEDPDYRKRVRERGRLPRRTQRRGISVAEYHSMVARQGGACAICRQSSKKPLCIDHCHLTGYVRALLCHKCNCGIGSYGDDPALVRAAMNYLEAARR
jgi:Recombination endonuclease VII